MNMENFEYVVNPPIKGPVCFGSSLQRDCVPRSGSSLSPFMRRVMPELYEKLAPNSYHVPYFRTRSHPMLRKIVATHGFGPLGYVAQRFPVKKIETRSNEFYDWYAPPLKDAYKPFGISLKEYKPYNPNNPGPGTYTLFLPPLDKLSTFGSKQYIIPAVVTICEPEFRDKCRRCNKLPDGDFWMHPVHQRYYCRRCMLLETEDIKLYSKTKSDKLRRLGELKSYKRVRYCGFYHDHQKTRAKPVILPKVVVVKQFQRENYLSKFYF